MTSRKITKLRGIRFIAMKKTLLSITILVAQLATGSSAQQPSSSPSPSSSPTEPLSPLVSPPPPQESAQQKPQKPEDVDVVRITTNLVQVDAVVTDKSGKVVTDLKPEEVQIFEDGRQQKITHFNYFVAETPPAETTVATNAAEKRATVDRNAPPVPPSRLRLEDVRRTIALVVDDLGLSFESTHFVQRALKKFVDEQMQPGDLVAIIRTSGGMGALQQFTADKRQLYAAIERVKWNSIGRSGVTAFAPIERPTEGDAGAAIDAANEEANQERQDMFAVGTLGAINYVVKGLNGLPGRKSILLISDGFRIYNMDDPTRNSLTRDRLHRLIDEAGRASVVIYTMNATGLQTLGFTAADDLSGRDTQSMMDALSNRRNEAFETQAGLDFLAQQTGGIAIKNTNDLSGGIKRVMEDQKGYYLIGYRPDNLTFDPRTGRRTFHKLSLKVTRPGKYNVRMRNGFYGVSDDATRQTTAKTLGQHLFEALASPFGATGVHLQLTSLFANDAKAGSFMRSVLHIDARDLTFTDEPNHQHKCIFDVLSMTFGDNGVPIDSTGRTYTVVLPDDVYKRSQRDGMVYYVTVPIKKAGAYQLRMALRDSSSDRIGSASQFVEIPDLKKNRLALSGIVLRGLIPEQKNSTSGISAATPGKDEKPPEASADSEAEGIEKGNALASPAVRRFSRGMVMSYGFFIYNARFEKGTTQSQLTTQVRLFRDGKEVFSGKANTLTVMQQTDLKRLLAAGAIQLGTDMAPGEYVLQVVVTDGLADEKHRLASQWMDFNIVK